MMTSHDASDEVGADSALQHRIELQRQYERRFEGQHAYRNRVWKILSADYFQQFIAADASVLDLGCGYAHFINTIRAGTKYAMDLNPTARRCVADDVLLIEQDCAKPWPLKDQTLDAVFSSNFFEHLFNKSLLRQTLQEARRCLKPGGRIICLGPNVRYLPGAYWDFWDHHVALTDRSLAEVLGLCGFFVERRIPRFLPFTMADGPEVPSALLKAYIHSPVLWPIFGRQFLLVGCAM